MNKAEVIAKVVAQSGVNEEDCNRVLKALESVLSAELADTKGVMGALDKMQKMLGFFQGKSA